MPSLKDIRKRRDSVRNTQKITSAMKMVAAAKLRRAQEAAESARPYAVKMNQVIAGLATRTDPSVHPLLEQRKVESKVLMIVVSSDRGLCGGYNSNIFRGLVRFIREQTEAGLEVHVATIGRKSVQFFRSQPTEVARNFEGVIGSVNYEKAREIGTFATESFVNGVFDKVYLVYNRFISAIQYETTYEALLPLSLDDIEGSQFDADAISEYIFEPDEATLLAAMLPAHIEVKVLHALLEAEASEHSARMTAMDNATTNAKDMIDSLTLTYNRARQAYITKELVEIVSGAEALQG